MPSADRRQFLVIGAGVVLGATLAGCAGDDGSPETVPFGIETSH
ncbi:MAG: hypothetical protein V5A55_10675 [Halovenus sp.]